MAAAASIPFVSVDEYLHTVYEPDVDYVDGYLEDRNVGEFDHALVQRALFIALLRGETAGNYLVAQELRVQVKPTRYRVPDTCLLPADKLPKRIAVEPPLLCVEVLSPEDRLTSTLRRCQDYLSMGVPEVWIVDPQEKAVHVLRQAQPITEVHEGELRIDSLAITLPLEALFARPEGA